MRIEKNILRSGLTQSLGIDNAPGGPAVEAAHNALGIDAGQHQVGIAGVESQPVDFNACASPPPSRFQLAAPSAVLNNTF